MNEKRLSCIDSCEVKSVKHSWPVLGACLGMLLLILDGQTALQGAREGAQLCLNTVIPSLFPFLMLSALLLDASTGASMRILQPLGKLCRIPAGAEPLLIPAFLGGYPVGAGSIGTAYRSGQLHKADAERMLGFCNNCGPAFLFGMGSSIFPKQWMIWALWGIHLTSAILASLLLPQGSCKEFQASWQKKKNISDILSSSLRVMAIICGWVVLFRVIIAFLNRWVLWLLPTQIQVILTGLLELTNGCCELPRIIDVRRRFAVCSAMLSLGGVCIAMQTASVTEGLSLKLYYRGKLIQTLAGLLFCAFLFGGKWVILGISVLLFALILGRKQKRSSISKPIGV